MSGGPRSSSRSGRPTNSARSDVDRFFFFVVMMALSVTALLMAYVITRENLMRLRVECAQLRARLRATERRLAQYEKREASLPVHELGSGRSWRNT